MNHLFGDYAYPRRGFENLTAVSLALAAGRELRQSTGGSVADGWTMAGMTDGSVEKINAKTVIGKSFAFN